MNAWWEWLILPLWILLYLAACLVLSAVLAVAAMSQSIRSRKRQ